MIYSNIPNPSAKFTATMYGKTVTIEIDHSDIDLSELLEVFKGLAIASGFANDSWNSVIKELAADIHDYEREDLKEKLNEWKTDDECNECDEDEYKDLRHSVGSWVKDSEGHEDYKGGFKDWAVETPIEDKVPFKEFGDEDDEVIEDEDELNKRMDIIGQNGNEGTHYSYEWDDNIKGYDYESNDMLSNINDSIQIIKDKMEDIDMRMDNIDEQLDILNADVANIEFNIQHPIKEALLNAKVVYDKSVIETERFNKVKEAAVRYSDDVKAKHVPIKDFDVVDMESGEVSEDMINGGFDNNKFKTPKVMGKWQTDNKTKRVVKLDKTKVRKGKIKDLKK